MPFCNRILPMLHVLIIIYIREQLHYNNGHQEVVTSIHFLKIKKFISQNSLDSNPGQQVIRRSFTGLRSYALSTEPSGNY